MKLVPYDISKIRYYRPCKLQVILNEFVNSGLDCVEVKDFTHKNAKSCANALNTSAKKSRMNTVHASKSLSFLFMGINSL